MTELEEALTQTIERMVAEIETGLLALSQRLIALEQQSPSPGSQLSQAASETVWQAWSEVAQDEQTKAIAKQRLQPNERDSVPLKPLSRAALNPPCRGCSRATLREQGNKWTMHCSQVHEAWKPLESPHQCSSRNVQAQS